MKIENGPAIVSEFFCGIILLAIVLRALGVIGK